MFRAIKEYRIPVTGSPSAAVALSVPTDPEVVSATDLQYRIRAKGCDVVAEFGSVANAASSTTVDGTSFARPDGCFSIADGAIEMFKPRKTEVAVSAVAEDGTSTGYLIVTVGVKE